MITRRLVKYIGFSAAVHGALGLVFLVFVLIAKLTTDRPLPAASGSTAAKEDPVAASFPAEATITNGSAELPERPGDVDLFEGEK